MRDVMVFKRGGPAIRVRYKDMRFDKIWLWVGGKVSFVLTEDATQCNHAGPDATNGDKSNMCVNKSASYDVGAMLGRPSMPQVPRKGGVGSRDTCAIPAQVWTYCCGCGNLRRQVLCKVMSNTIMCGGVQ